MKENKKSKILSLYNYVLVNSLNTLIQIHLNAKRITGKPPTFDWAFTQLKCSTPLLDLTSTSLEIVATFSIVAAMSFLVEMVVVM